jgi:hypothetical protein
VSPSTDNFFASQERHSCPTPAERMLVALTAVKPSASNM